MRNRCFGWLGLVVCLFGLSGLMSAEETEKKEEAAGKVEEPQAKLSEDGTMLELPGVKVMIKEKYVDVDVKVCLTDGLLELVACAKDTKEHESIVMFEAKAAMVHAGLLLLGAEPGNPAMRKLVEGKEGVWIDLEPRGAEVEVFLVVKDDQGKDVERPISDFIMKAEEYHGENWEAEKKDEKDKEKEKFPTHTFLFAGSHLHKEGDNPPVYLADVDGNVISLSTFGDEMLCLPGIHGHGNDRLAWAVNPEHLPALGEKAIMRLRPKLAEKKEGEK